MNIIFFHMNQLGDLLFSLPVLSAARKQNPQNRIICVARQQFLPLLAASGFADELVAKNTGICLCAKLPVIMKLRKEKAWLGVFFSESHESMLLGFSLGIKQRVGFSTANLPFLLTKTAERTGVPSLENNRKLGIAAGFTDIPKDYCGLVNIPEVETAAVTGWLSVNKIEENKLVVLAPGASKRRADKSWSIEGWKNLIKLITENGYSTVITGAPSEKEKLENITMGFSCGVKVFASDAGILATGALIKKAKLFIGIDSGAAHLAASLGTKVIGLFGRTDPGQIGPMPLEKNIIIKKDVISQITAEEVWEKAAGVLR
jgi:ADP-heptose:LPS heptosyltransferase